MGQKALQGARIWISDAITEADTGTTKAVLNVPAGTLVTKVGIVVTEAFAGGSPLIDIGDGDNPDGWIDQGDITATTIGSYMGDETTTAAYSDTGRYYVTADTIDAVVSASLTNGTAYVWAEYLDLTSDLV